MDEETLEFTADLFPWGEGSWYFLRLPRATAEDLRDQVTAPPRGFGSIRVAVKVGASAWTTSVFPEKQSGSFLLPVKKAIRTAEGLEDGDQVAVSLRALED